MFYSVGHRITANLAISG